MAAETEKELQQLKKRFIDLANRSWRQNLFVFTGFLSMAEQQVLWQAAGEMQTRMELFGGAKLTERQMVRFGNPEEMGYEEPFPITCILVEPVLEKFSDDFTHRDFLGAVMNLGIDRSTVGDIFLDGKKAYLFCTEQMAPYLIENLSQVRHTRVKCSVVPEIGQVPERKYAVKEEQVASLRCDSVVAVVYNLSRSQSLDLFRAKKIFVNGRQMENNSYLLKEQDVVSVRGFGKFLFQQEKHTTRKGKLVVEILVFV